MTFLTFLECVMALAASVMLIVLGLSVVADLVDN